MAHDHAHGAVNDNRAFAIGICLNIGFVVAEAVFGVAADSLALLADAGHNLSDVLGLFLAWGAGYLARLQPTERRTYGLRRSTILAALLNSVLILIAVGAIAREAVGRLFHPASVAGGTVIAVAAVGVLVNAVTALLFFAGGWHDLNIYGAFLHMAADAAVSLGVVVAGVIIGLTGLAWVDPAVSLLIAAVIAVGTWSLFRHSIDLSLDAVPAGIDPVSVRAFLASLPGVADVHDLHIWGVSTTETALTVHLVRPDARANDAWLAQLNEDLHERFRIDHATFQVERGMACQFCRLN